jgi:hypothetical protein
MKRFWIGVLILGISLFALCFPPTLGHLLKAGIYLKNRSSLSFSQLYFKDGGLAIDDLVLSKPDEYILRTEHASVQYHWPSTLSIEMSHPHITLSTKVLKEKAHTKSSPSSCFLASIEDGLLDWMEDELPPARFAMQNGLADFRLLLQFEQGKITIHNEKIVAEQIPLVFAERWLAIQGYPAPLSASQGFIFAEYDGNKLSARGQDLSFQWADRDCGGSFSLDWHGDSVISGTNRLRLLVENGRVATIQKIDLQASFQVGVGGKVECRAIADELPLAFEGKAFMSPNGSGWLMGDGKLGDANWTAEWKEDTCHCQWSNVGPKEISALQAFIPFQGHLLSGNISGKASYCTSFQLNELLVEDLFFQRGALKGGAKQITLNKEGWLIEKGWIDEFEWDGTIGAQGNIDGTYRQLPAHISWGEDGQIRASWGDFRLEGDYAQKGDILTLSVTRAEGPFIYGTVDYFEGSFDWDLKRFQLEDWSLHTKISKGIYDRLSDVNLTLFADPNGMEWSGDAILTVRSQKLPIKARKCRLEGENAQFDIRIEDKNWDILRLVGKKEGTQIQFDPTRTQLFGSPLEIEEAIWDQGTLQKCRFKANFDWWHLESLFQLNKNLPIGAVSLTGNYDAANGCTFTATGSDWQTSGKWFQDTVIGKAQVKDLSFEYNGRLDGQIKIDQLSGDISSFTPLKGQIQGAGNIVISSDHVEADFDLTAPKLLWNENLIELNHPVHTSFSSGIGVVFTGLDGKFREAEGKIEQVSYDAQNNMWNVERAQLHIPAGLLPIQEIEGAADLVGNVRFSSDLSEFEGEFSEAYLPIYGEVRMLRNIHVKYHNNAWIIDAECKWNEQWAKIKLDPTKRTLLLQDGSQGPLKITWREDKTIDAIDGSFAGIQTNFVLSEGRITGQAFIDFRSLVKWMPSDLAKALTKLQMGDGYEVKGSFHPETFEFQGILTGKQFDLFGVQLRTLFSHLHWQNGKLDISGVEISDSAMKLTIDQIQIDGTTIAMPHFSIQDLRPSLLHKRGKDEEPPSPLQVRSLEFRDFKGTLNDEKTYTAKGNLSFINTYKRVETLFDIPSQFFGRIIGLDFDLLIPVTGDLDFEIRDGYIWLGELKNAFSEAKRSEFFLVRTDTSPRMDLDGNLEIHVRTKQYVLFTLTEGFMISIEGDLSNPKFRLQKKMKFS